jgi:hypothetical protein
MQMGVSVIESAKDRQNQGLIADWLAHVGERVGEVLELGAVVTKGEVALRSVAEVGLKLDRAMLLVIAEEVLDGVLDGARGGAGAHVDVEEAGGDGAVYPGEHGVVIATPSRGRGLVGGSGIAGDVAGEAVATEGDEEEFPLAGVVALVEAKRDWNL